jgi:two-component system NtrC family sensor kinase
VGTPLNSVLAHLDLLHEDLPQGKDRQRLDLAVRELERVSEVIRRYLRTTRAPTPRRQRVAIEPNLRESLRVFESEAAARGVALTIEAPAKSVPTDPDLLAQIVRNLVSNALAAVSQTGRVEVSASLDGNNLRIRVADNGIGMDTETRTRLFEPFYTARPDGREPADEHRAPCSGLPGSIDESAPGQGTVVTVLLPINETSAETAADSVESKALE